MDDTAPIAPTAGHNKPPAEDETFDTIKARVEAFIENADLWLKSVEKISDEQMAKACEGFLKQVRDLNTLAEDTRKEINRPYDKAIKDNNDRFRPVTAALKKIKERLDPLRTAWLQHLKDEQERKRREAEERALEEMRKAEEAKKAAAEGKGDLIGGELAAEEQQRRADEAAKEHDRLMKQKVGVKADNAQRASSLRSYYSAKVQQPMMVLRQIWETGTPAEKSEIEALAQKLANARAREQKNAFVLPGAQLHEEQRAA